MFVTWEWFTTLAEEKSFTKAAASLGISQQTLSSRLASLERDLEAKLMVRGTPLSLTPAGMAFLIYAREQQQAQQDMLRQIGEVTGSGAGQLKVGISPLRCRTLMPQVARKMVEALPDVSIRLMEGTNQEVTRMAERGEVDAVVARFGNVHPGVEVTPLYKEEVVLAVHEELLERVCGMPAQEAKARIEAEGLGLLKDCPFVMGTVEDVSGRIAYSELRNAGITPHVTVSSQSMTTLLSMGCVGLGAVFCPVNMLNATTLSDRMVRIRLSEQATYTIELGIPMNMTAWHARDVLKRTLIELTRD
ncbi:MAG: LysR family transcriptional regulator [Coriobacteriia bacterium]|nr:LysR family transcriptional regulator [Coriobacteriia bacterium]